jgi:predicted dehydrogenase
MYRDGRLTHFTDLETDWAFSFAEGVRDFVNAVVDGRECQLDGAEGKEVLRFALATQLSAKEGREVKLGEVTA